MNAGAAVGTTVKTAKAKKPPSTNPKRRRTGCVKAACVACYAAKAKCTDTRPCQRCTARNLECVTRQQHKRGRKTLSETKAKKSKKSASAKSVVSSAFPDLALLAEAANFSNATALPPCPFAILLALLNDEGTARIQHRLLKPGAILAHHICYAMGSDADAATGESGAVARSAAATSSFLALDRATQGLDDLLASELLDGSGLPSGGCSGRTAKSGSRRKTKRASIPPPAAATAVPVHDAATPHADIRPPTIARSGASAGVPFYSRSFVRLASEIGAHLRHSAKFRAEIAVLVKVTPSTSTSNSGLKSSANRGALLASYCEYVSLLGRHMTAFLGCQGVDTMELLYRMQLLPIPAEVKARARAAAAAGATRAVRATAAAASSSGGGSAPPSAASFSFGASSSAQTEGSSAEWPSSSGGSADFSERSGVSDSDTFIGRSGSNSSSGGFEKVRRKKSGLPPCVVLCNMVKGMKRYGAKVKTPGKKTQMRIGSTFADPQSALTAAQVFKRTAIVDNATGIVSLDPMRCQLEQDKVCCVYRNRTMDVVKVSAIRVLLDVLKKKKKRHRKSSSSPAAKGGATVPNMYTLEASGALARTESTLRAVHAGAASGARTGHASAVVRDGAVGGAASASLAAAAPRASHDAASPAAAAADADASSPFYMQRLPPAVVAMSLLCFLVEMNELERGKRVQLIGPLWLCIPSDSTTTQRDHLAAGVGVGIGLSRAHSFIGAAGAAAAGVGFGKVFTAASEIVAMQKHSKHSGAMKMGSLSKVQQQAQPSEIQPIMLRASSGGGGALAAQRPARVGDRAMAPSHALRAPSLARALKQESWQQPSRAIGNGNGSMQPPLPPAHMMRPAGLAVDLRRGPLKVLALAESRAASFSLSSELHPITPQQLYPIASSSVTTAAGTVAQAQQQASWRAQQQAQQQARAAAGASGDLQPIPLGGPSRLNASAHWQLAGMGANSFSSSRIGSVDFGGMFAAAQAGGSMAMSGSSVAATRTRHPSAGYATSAAAAIQRRPSAIASHDAFTQLAHAAVAHTGASPRASASASALAASASASSSTAAGASAAAPASQSTEPYTGLSGLFVRDDARSESLVNLFSVCCGTSGPLMAAMLHSLDGAIIVDHIPGTTFDIQLRVITSWSKICTAMCSLSLAGNKWQWRGFLAQTLLMRTHEIAADVVLIEAVNSTLSTKLQCELRLMADGNTLAVRFVGLCMQDSVAGDDPDGGTWTVVARASRHYVRQEVTPLCFGLGGGTEMKEGIQKKPSWVY